MQLKKLLSKGYFPKELPPPFITEEFGDKSRYINKKWSDLLTTQKAKKGSENSKQAKARFKKDYTEKYGSSSLIEYSIAKGIYSRRKLEIPNPKQYLDIGNTIIDNWKLLKEYFDISSYSQSKPVLNGAKRALKTKSKSLNNFKFEAISKSFGRKIELRLDILNFYPTIYTHSIPWSLLGKEDAKKYFKLKKTRRAYFDSILLADKKARLYNLGDLIDTLVRNCNERQSVGIPIGPDVSFLLAELVGCRIDAEIENSLVDISHECIRYYDDYYFYLDSIGDADNVLKKVQKILYEFRLETNEFKVNINELPFKYVDDWSLSLSLFKFSSANDYELRNFFSQLISLVEKNKKQSSWIINYGLQRFEYGNVKVKRKHFDIFLTFLLQLLLFDPSNIDQIFKILLSYEYYLSKKRKEKIKIVLNQIIEEHSILNHSFEVSWALWIFKSFKIKCHRNYLTFVLNSNDSISKMLCLDLIDSKLFYGRKPALANLTKSLNSNSLFNGDWLISYESYRKSWLNFKTRKIFDLNEFFEILNHYDITFYDSSRQLDTNFSVSPPPEIEPDDFDSWFDDFLNDDEDEEKEEKKSKY
ncbi:RNA-directed DNA polymerase [Tamlana sp. 2201CG12-4]|uniref:RNA-directed DNA polymerase n=1 Tax=Tamlana sp. 2201CG12-4 TaxID=3112582 RepID=UPI002DB6912D|nr:RNA-directed DNA polymerase [Tamlana sp. 2201CG12-4]MEC3905911.1 RNA-directed DNA polymerase [Tamlana sp. 2201CG12-4]